MATRKERKQARRLKKFTKQLGEETKKLLKKLAKEMSSKRFPDLGIKFHCRTCGQSWERAHDNTVVFCRECHYFECCLKDIKDFRVCPECGRV